ncbi:MAG: oxygen-independent coproporphyrinogen oxidase [Fluviicola sp.]|uniref:radical SAM family heme chaperone HemW n=1 Tax=Fluviicola sp. TaxID=1917219 RepID=UPI0026205C07|nr:radical SAM family heme chaperone HemW [Fluviicola sp.]MDF3028330.1 oxygen-independent coproporphyrinogen oxidase [Fluviicola sp.]
MTGCYIHIPFCARKCSYCDFHFSTNHSYQDKMVNSLCMELEMRAKTWNAEIFQTIYFGGGTPSVLTASQLEKLIGKVKAYYRVDDSVEITLECNPDDCSLENLENWKKLGVNRLSIGIQSFNDEQLKWMNRSHKAADSLNAVQNAKQVGFDELSLDLMYGLPNMTPEEWKAQLLQIIALNPEHVSAYCLTVEQKTALSKWVNEGKLVVSTNEQQSEQFEMLVSTLGAAGYEQYEISNFARNGHYSAHNTSYWKGAKYLGIGPSAHGYDQVERYWNQANNKSYMADLENGKLPETREILSSFDQFNETLMIGLRTKWGVSKQQLFKMLSPDEEWFKIVKEYEDKNLLVQTEENIALTAKGRLLADGIAADLFLIASS